MEEFGSRGRESQNGSSWKVASPTYHHGSTSTNGGGLSSEHNGGTESLLEKTGEFSNGYSGLKNGVDFWDSKTSPGHVTLDVTLTAENSGIQNGGEINLEVEDKCKNEDTYVVNPPLSRNSLQNQNAKDISIKIERELKETELYLETLYKKPGKHDFYCPNCKVCIDKVLIRSEEVKCPTCFEFLKPIGEWIFGERKSSKQENDPEIPHDDKRPYNSAITSLGVVTSVASADAAKKNDPETPCDNKKANNNVAPPSPGSITSLSAGPSAASADAASKNDHKIPPNNKTANNTVQVQPEPPLPPPLTSPPPPATAIKREILKSIVFGGLTESITSLGVVTSAASVDATTMNIIALALANLVGGLFVIGHNIKELKNDPSRVSSNGTDEEVDRYQEVLGQKRNFILHASVAILSFLVFGLVPPVVYGFSFYESDNRDLKLAAVAAASLLCITLLAIVKAYIQKPTDWYNYITNILYYLAIGLGVSGISFLAGYLVRKLIEKLGWFESSVAATLSLPEMNLVKPAWGSY
ncbi:membrane protein of ER body 1 isoform X3 [Quercus suber]|uniref:membrane protein of ER body 1 isoform X3 n=1 Tax=Quercus suber TaxID=58331 RepID=UPI000CE272A9|nr:membrane protein of ER body 1-like isoform X3 [Quercus suber]POE60215.1 isoform 3 of membrane protein of er body 1 [Quercus suber]